MSPFPDTPVTMLARIAAQHTCESESSWVRLFALYEPVIRKCAKSLGAGCEDEDVAQEIFVKLVDVLKNGRYSPAVGKFRNYLTTLIRNELIGRWRKAQVRKSSDHVSLDDADSAPVISVPESVSAEIDAKWYRARHEAAVDHALTKTAMSRQPRFVFVKGESDSNRDEREKAFLRKLSPGVIRLRFNSTEELLRAVTESLDKYLADNKVAYSG